MPRATNTVRVQAIPGEQFRYRVESWEDPAHPHTVDLMEHDGNGECDCLDFVTRCSPNITKHGGKIIPYGRPGKPNPERTQCRHIFAALMKDAPELYRRISRKLRQHQTATRP
jgi:hypothetical protein